MMINLVKIDLSEEQISSFIRKLSCKDKYFLNCKYYLMHALIKSLFSNGENDVSPKNFYFKENGFGITSIYFYSKMNDNELLNHYLTTADASVEDILSKNNIVSIVKDFSNAKYVCFTIKAFPIIRQNTKKYVDYHNIKSDMSKEEAYSLYVKNQINNTGCLEIIDAPFIFNAKSTDRIFRTHGHNRKSFKQILPECEARCSAKIIDIDKFYKLLHSGIGRNRAFGFGMLKINNYGK